MVHYSIGDIMLVIELALLTAIIPVGTLIAIGAAELYRRYELWRTWRRNFK